MKYIDNEYIFRLRNLKLENFKAISIGKISFLPQSIDEEEEDEAVFKSEIVGIYGPNGSGKSSIINAFELLTSITKKEANINEKNFKSYIKQGTSYSNLSFIFSVYDCRFIQRYGTSSRGKA